MAQQWRNIPLHLLQNELIVLSSRVNFSVIANQSSKPGANNNEVIGRKARIKAGSHIPQY